MNKVCLYIDDVRNPPEGSWVIVRSVGDAIDYIVKHGLPDFMSLDHDLGGDETVMQFLHWLADHYFSEGPPRYMVHSDNPVGRDNIVSFLECWKKANSL